MFPVVFQDLCKELGVQNVNHLISALKVRCKQAESANKLEKVNLKSDFYLNMLIFITETAYCHTTLWYTVCSMHKI